MNPKPLPLPRSSTMVERLNRLRDVFQSDDRVLIVISADPDAIGSAMALKRLLWRRVGSVTVARTNVIARPDNLELLKYLRLVTVDLNGLNLRDFTRLAMVDSQPHHFRDLASRHFHAIIDHHPRGPAQAEFLDIRPDYGAVSTMMTEYLRAAKIKPSQELATALYYGIKTDTANFVRQGQIEDMRAFRFLFPFKNQSIISKIENANLSRASLKYFQRALDNARIQKDSALTFVGRVDSPDTLVILADFFLRIQEIHRSVVAGIFKDKLIVIFRTSGPRMNAGKLATDSLGPFGAAGGHKTMARAEAPLANLDPKILEREGGVERFLLRRMKPSARTACDLPKTKG